MTRKKVSIGIAIGLACTVALAPGAGAELSAKDGSGITFERASNERGSVSVGAFRIKGSMDADDFKITITDNGRFKLKSRAGSLTPIVPPDGCRVDGSHVLSCNEGVVRELVARLKRGRDTFISTPRIRFRMLLVGGAQQDRLIGGRGDDELQGRNGGDRLDGRRGADLLRGGLGRDVIERDRNDTIRTGPGRDIILR